MISVKSDKDLLFTFIEGVTGNSHDVDFRSEVVLNAVGRLIEKAGCTSLLQYLCYLGQDKDALTNFIKETTIHTTRWFRESKHLQMLEDDVVVRLARIDTEAGNPVHFKAASFGCSSGQEVYSMAMILEKYRISNDNFNYEVSGYDVDAVSIERANRAIYPISDIGTIPEEYMPMVWQGQDATQGLFTLDKEIRNRCFFKCENILDDQKKFSRYGFDAVFIRNILIYFSQKNAARVIETACTSLDVGGNLYLGHSESHLVPGYLPFKAVSSSVFMKVITDKRENRAKKVLVIEDSVTVQTVLKNLLQNAGFDVDCVSSKGSLEKYIKTQSEPDIISLDLQMPQFSGEQWLKNFRLHNQHTPVVVISSLFADDAFPVLSMLSAGAVDYIEKKLLSTDSELVVRRFRAFTSDSFLDNTAAPTNDLKKVEMSPKVILIGASTGGIRALKEVLQGLPVTLAPVVIVQHISPQFASELAKCLERLTGLKIGCTEKTSLLKNGHIYIASGDFHLTVKSSDEGLSIVPTQYPDHQFKPSVDILFLSVDKILCKDTVSILLSGMGRDGVDGMGKLHRNGALTIAQNKETAAVFGMPGEAIKSGYARHISEPVAIREFLLRTASG